MTSAEAIRSDIVRLTKIGHDRYKLAREAMRVLRRAVPFDGAAVVWFDPATALPVDQWTDGSREADVEAFRQLAASGRRAERAGDELRAVCVGEAGMWGALAMYRERGFTTRDADLLAAVAGGFEEVARARVERDADAGDRDPGLLLLDDHDNIELADAGAAAWLDELRANGRPPLVVTAVAERARAIAAGRSEDAATARVQTDSGRWVLVRGSVLGNGTDARTAVTLEAARAPELAALMADAYGLTARERRVTELVAQGLCTAAIAAKLYLSSYTVQDHLKAVFEKLGVSSRGEVVARLFVDDSLALGPS